LPGGGSDGILARYVSFGALVLARLASAAWVAPEPAQAEPLVWVAPPSVCPEPAEVRRRLVRLMGADVARVRAEARVSAGASRWRVDLALKWQGHQDVRTLEADRCDTLADATVLLVASAADPLQVLLHAPEPSTTAAAAVPEPPPAREVVSPRVAPREVAAPAPAPAPVSNEDRPARPRDRGPAVGWLGLFDVGSMPRVAAGLGASIAWRWPRARLFAEGTYLPAQQVRSTASHARNGRVQLGMARVGACGRLWVRAVELPVCSGIEAGGTRASAFGSSADLSALDRWVAVFAHGGVVIPLMPSMAAVARVEVAVPLAYSEYLFGEEQLYRARPVLVRGALGLEFRWGRRNTGQPENPRGGKE
jgi:hypothetical protein